MARAKAAPHLLVAPRPRHAAVVLHLGSTYRVVFKLPVKSALSQKG